MSYITPFYLFFYTFYAFLFLLSFTGSPWFGKISKFRKIENYAVVLYIAEYELIS